MLECLLVGVWLRVGVCVSGCVTVCVSVCGACVWMDRGACV